VPNTKLAGQRLALVEKLGILSHAAGTAAVSTGSTPSQPVGVMLM
jgi:hypothetical protein